MNQVLIDMYKQTIDMLIMPIQEWKSSGKSNYNSGQLVEAEKEINDLIHRINSLLSSCDKLYTLSVNQYILKVQQVLDQDVFSQEAKI